MGVLLASVLEQSFEAIQEKVALVKDSVSWVQIDISDGVFTPTCTWPFAEGDMSDISLLPSSLSYELHAMVADPVPVVGLALELPFSRILLHFESYKDVALLREHCMTINATEGKEAGVVLNMQTPIASLAPLIDCVSCVQLMSIDAIGVQGNPFNEGIYARIEELRTLMPDAIIEIDGGVSLENVSRLVSAGANNLSVGSALLKAPDIRARAAEFQKILQ